MKYSVEDLEFLKQRTNITYDEAVEILKRYDGDVAQAIIMLEKQGKLKAPQKQGRDASKKNAGEGQWMGLLKKLMTHRLVVKKDETVIANLSWLFLLITLFTAPWLAILAFLSSMALGYKYSHTVNCSMSGHESKNSGDKETGIFKNFTAKKSKNPPISPAKTGFPKGKKKGATEAEVAQAAAEANRLAQEVQAKVNMEEVTAEIFVE